MVVKAQVLSGGRGKGHFDNGLKGGVHFCKNAEGATELAQKMIKHSLITKQTGSVGAFVNSVLVTESVNFSREFYFSILMEPRYNGPIMVFSACGGMDIENVCKVTPERIIVEPINIFNGPTNEQIISVARRIGFSENILGDAITQLERLYDLFIYSDAHSW